MRKRGRQNGGDNKDSGELQEGGNQASTEGVGALLGALLCMLYSGADTSHYAPSKPSEGPPPTLKPNGDWTVSHQLE